MSFNSTSISQNMKCTKCLGEIPKARLEAAPNTTTCVKCSTVKPYVCFNVFPHKTGSYIVKVDPNDKEALRRAKRADSRSR